MAEDAGLDLVILSPDAELPVLRIMDYDKYRYDQRKRKREQQKKSAAGLVDLKELKMGYNIDIHDYSVHLKAAKKFLKDGDKVACTIHGKISQHSVLHSIIYISIICLNLKGHENEFRNNAIELIRRFQNDIGELATEVNEFQRHKYIHCFGAK